MKTGKSKVTEGAYMPNIPRSYAIDEILEAGGPAIFADKIGKTPKDLITKLSSLPADAFLTDAELNDALAILKENK